MATNHVVAVRDILVARTVMLTHCSCTIHDAFTHWSRIGYKCTPNSVRIDVSVFWCTVGGKLTHFPHWPDESAQFGSLLEELVREKLVNNL